MVVLTNVWLIVLTGVACALAPVKPEPEGMVHVKVVPGGTLLGAPSDGSTLKAVPLHTVCCCVVETNGTGVTVIL